MPSFARHDKRALEALEKELEDALNEEVPEPDGPEETLSLASYNPHPVAAAWKIKVREPFADVPSFSLLRPVTLLLFTRSPKHSWNVGQRFRNPMSTSPR